MLYAGRTFTVLHELGEADVCFLGVPFDSTALAEGNQRFGPITVRYALKTCSSYIQEKDRNPFRQLKIADAGDLDWVPGSYEKTSERLRDTVNSILQNNPSVFPVFIGGEHLITLPIVRELQPKTIVQLDAHADLMEDYHGERFNHASWARRVREENDLDIVQIGVRTFLEKDEEARKELNIKDSLEGLKGPVYLTVDMDVFDPSYAPDTGCKEEGGMPPGEVFGVIDKVFEENEVVGMDVCEIASKELNNRTSHLAGKVILRALSNLC